MAVSRAFVAEAGVVFRCVCPWFLVFVCRDCAGSRKRGSCSEVLDAGEQLDEDGEEEELDTAVRRRSRKKAEEEEEEEEKRRKVPCVGARSGR